MTSTLVDVRTTDLNRITRTAKAAEEQHKHLIDQLKVDQTQLTAADAAVAAAEQKASRLRQELAAATTGPERHRIELAIDEAVVERIRASAQQVDAAVKVANGRAAITRTAASISALSAAQTTAQAALDQATTDADAVATSRKDLDKTLTDLKKAIGELAPDRTLAAARLDVLLGSPALHTGLAERLNALAAADRSLRAMVSTAEEQVIAKDTDRSAVDGALEAAAAQHAKALAAVQDAASALARLDAVKAAVTAAAKLPDLDADDQKAIADAVATPTRTQLENWAIKVPAPLLAAAVAQIDAEAVLATLEDLAEHGATPLLKALDDAETPYAAALEAQLAATHALDDAIAQLTVAHDAVDAAAPTFADRRALAVSGHTVDVAPPTSADSGTPAVSGH